MFRARDGLGEKAARRVKSRAGLARANVDRGGDPLNLSSVADVEARAPVRLGRVESEVE